MGAMGFGKPKILHSHWQHHKGLRCWVHFCTLHWVHMLPTYKFHYTKACRELPFAPLLSHHPFESMIFLVCIFLVVITFGSTYLTHLCFDLHHLSFFHLNVPHFMFQFASFKFGLILVPCFVFQSLSFELEFILMLPTLCFKPCCLNFCPSWFIPLCFSPHHMNLNSSLSRCTIKCFSIVMKQCFFHGYYLFKCIWRLIHP